MSERVREKKGRNSKHPMSQVSLVHEGEHSYSTNTRVGDVQRVKKSNGLLAPGSLQRKRKIHQQKRKGFILMLRGKKTPEHI